MNSRLTVSAPDLTTYNNVDSATEVTEGNNGLYLLHVVLLYLFTFCFISNIVEAIC